MPQDLMRYEQLTQTALRGVVKGALDRVAVEGLPGEHHFYITFATQHPNVSMSDALKASYPEEMTIVLQHQYWDLEVGEDFFSVSLTFNKVPERLVIPFAAVKTFFDPSVKFGLQFQVPDLPVAGTEPGLLSPDGAAADAGDPDPAGPAEEAAAAEGGSASDGEVVSLDAFRKKK
jgi:hypothetical protein